ncbi:MAG: agmatinase [archaeon]
MTYLPRYNFGMLPEEYSNYKDSRVVILPVPYGATVSYMAGTHLGPDAVIKASQNMELYDRKLGSIFECGIHTLPSLEPVIDPEEMVNQVEVACTEHLKKGKFVAMIGGEHSLTTGAVRAAKTEYRDLSVLQLDAHADLREEYEGTKYNHACVMNCVSEICDFAGVGIRSLSEEEGELIKAKGCKEYYAEDIAKRAGAMDNAIESLSNDVYVTIDLDAFDPSIMPAVGTPEPGGLGWYQTLDFLEKVFKKKNVVGFDIVELCPIPGIIFPDFTAAKLVYKLIGFKAREGFK